MYYLVGQDNTLTMRHLNVFFLSVIFLGTHTHFYLFKTLHLNLLQHPGNTQPLYNHEVIRHRVLCELLNCKDNTQRKKYNQQELSEHSDVSSITKSML